MTKTTITCDVCGTELISPGVQPIEIDHIQFRNQQGYFKYADFTVRMNSESSIDACPICTSLAIKKAIIERIPMP